MKTLSLLNMGSTGVLSFVKRIEPDNSKKQIPSVNQTEITCPHSVLFNLLFFVSFGYLIFPVVIFIGGFVRTEIAVVLLGLICLTFCSLVREAITSVDLEAGAKTLLGEWRIWRRHVLVMSVLVFVWLLFSSIGGIGYRNFDSGIRSSLLWHLVTGPWPVRFEAGYFGKEFGSISDKAYVYYFAYYLPAAVVGKFWGWKAANLALFAYSWLGAVLALGLARVYVREPGYRVTLIVFMGISLFGGMDFVFNRLLGFTGDRSEMWLSPLHYFSHTRNLFWAPQHCLPAWLMVGIILNRRLVSPLLMRFFPLAIVSILLWSPLCLIGIVPFILAIAGDHWKKWVRFGLENMLACLLFVLLTTFIISNDFSFEVFFASGSIPDYWKQYGLLILSEFALISSIFVFTRCKLPDFEIIITAFALLFAIPFLILGKWNDWSIKLSMPPLFVLSVFMIKQMIALIEQNGKAALISFLLFSACALTPLEELVYSMKNYRISFEVPPEIREFGPNYVVWQQLGDPGSFFFRYLAKRQ